MSPGKKAARVCAQLVGILALTALLTEGAFRLVDRYQPLYIFPDGSYNRFRARPHVLVQGELTNSRGFRDVEVDKRRPAGRYRILGIGDSFAFGVVPYRDNFLTLVEEDLAASGSLAAAVAEVATVEVVNMGIPRTGVKDYRALLEDEGLLLDPDMVLLCLFLGNDLVLGKSQSETSVLKRSYLLAFLRFAFRILPAYEGGGTYRATPNDDNEPTLTREAYGGILSVRIRLFRKREPSFIADFPQVIETLEEISRLCAEHEIALRVVLIPDELQIVPEVRQGLTYYRPHRYDFELPNKKLHPELERLGIEFLDLLPILRQATAAGPVYKPRDSHWNVRGNRVAATAIAEWLRRSAAREASR